MGLPYSAPLITRLLRSMSDAQLRTAKPHDFHLAPVTKVIVPSAIITDLIRNERARRAS